MRLSVAIRLGAMVHPQGFGSLVNASDPYAFDKATIQRTCALGAAWVASGGGSYVETVKTPIVNARGSAAVGASILRLEIPIEWEITLRLETLCPVNDCSGHGPLAGAIQHLNDDHRWTREQIADFVERVEQASSAPAVREDVASPVVAIRAEESSGTLVS